MDIMSSKERSKRMSLIRSKWTKPERIIHNYLKGRKIRHRMHPPIKGSPDLVLADSKTAIFIHGCFWHKCPRCYKEPMSNTNYWLPKMERNISRDRRNTRILRKNGWKVHRIWEHEIKKDMDVVTNKILEY